MRSLHSRTGSPPSAERFGVSGYDGDCNLIRRESEAGCRDCPIGQQARLAPLYEAKLQRLLAPIGEAVVPVGVTIYEEGFLGPAAYVVRQGLLKLVKNASAGPRIVRLLGPGSAAGLEAYLAGQYRHTAVAMRPSELCRIPLAVLHELQRHDGGFVGLVLAQWERQLESADRWLADLAQGTVPERLQRFMAIVADTEEGLGAWVQLPPITDLASILGCSRESVSRTLSGLERTRTLRRVGARTYTFEQGRRPF
jgi:CRP-like cAMP-binding protein